MTISIIGCVVNGPGEARETDIGLTGGGNGTHLIYMAGVADHKLGTADMIEHIVELVEHRAAEIEAEIEAAAQAEDEQSPGEGGQALPGKAGVPS